MSMERASTGIGTGCGRRNAFTLIELLTVIVIIGIIASLVLAATVAMKQRARAKQAEALALSLVLAIREYHAEYGEWPCPSPGSPASGGTWSNNNDAVINGYLLSTAGANNSHRRTFWETAGVATNPLSRLPFVITIDVTNESVSVN